MEIWPLWKTKKGIPPICGCVRISVWSQPLDSNKTFGEKARWEIHKITTCCFEQILEAAPHKTAAE